MKTLGQDPNIHAHDWLHSQPGQHHRHQLLIVLICCQAQASIMSISCRSFGNERVSRFSKSYQEQRQRWQYHSHPTVHVLHHHHATTASSAPRSRFFRGNHQRTPASSASAARPVATICPICMAEPASTASAVRALPSNLLSRQGDQHSSADTHIRTSMAIKAISLEKSSTLCKKKCVNLHRKPAQPNAEDSIICISCPAFPSVPQPGPASSASAARAFPFVGALSPRNTCSSNTCRTFHKLLNTCRTLVKLHRNLESYVWKAGPANPRPASSASAAGPSPI